ncbi:MAG: N-acetyl-gamma-glutamyl-phosphate reductase [Candidatus Altiarchaeota archaeon]|nr:N-acetyl-gamma-glutamyl-phosphate reductase [Candidatus Altiarchaeota archaeon]
MKVLVVGGSGYTGSELLRLLLSHNKVEDIDSTSRTYLGKKISSVHRNLTGFTEKNFIEFDPEKTDADMVFLALPHGKSMQAAPKLVERGIKTVDLGADYRLKDQSLYESYYLKHTSPELLKDAVYGLPELFRKDIKNAKLVANPGCYATAAILSLAPISRMKATIDLKRIVVDAKSGTSGAGAKPTETIHHCEANNCMTPYKVVGHRHEPEINHILSRLVHGVSVSFTPTLAPMTRGILSNAHVFMDSDTEAIRKAYVDFYKGEKFVRILDDVSTKNVAYTNLCDIATYFDKNKGRAVIACAIDNLIKGASGQAIQNMNLIMGYAEDEGLKYIPYHP